MQELKFPISSTPGALAGEGDGRLVNAYAEKDGDQIYMRRSPGLTTPIFSVGSGPRGMFTNKGQAIFSAFTDAAYYGDVPLTGVLLSGSLGVTWAENTDGQTVAVKEDGGAFVTTTTNITAYSTTDADIPSDVNSVTFGNGYFFFSSPTGQITASGLNDLSIDPLSFAYAESRSDPLKRVVWHGSVLYAFGEATIEPWLDTGDIPFPLTRGTSVIPCGLLTTMAVGGAVQGWDRPLYFVAHDGTVRALTGYTTKVVSTPPVDRFIKSSTKSTVVVFVYTFRGHGMVVVSSNLGTWEYNVTTGLWNERQSASGTGWRAKYATKQSDVWLAGDTLSSNMLQISDTVYAENGASLTFQVDSSPFKAFPAGMAIPALFLEFTDAAATAAISYSKDGGATWTTPETRTLANAEKWPVRVNSLGLMTHHGLRVRVTVATAVDFSLMGASISGPEVRRPKPDQVKAA